MDSKKVIRQLKSDDAYLINQALMQIYDSYHKLVCFIIAKYIDNSHDIEEIANDVFLSLYTHRDNLNESKNLKYYLTSISRNKTLNFIKKVSPLSLENFCRVEMDDFSATVSSHIDFDTIIDQLSEVLTQEEQKIILMHLIEGYTFHELSKLFSSSLNTIKSTYRRSLNKFQQWREKNEKK